MSKALMKQDGPSAATGLVPAVASAIVPGLGQLINGESDKALGVFAVSAIAGLSVIRWIPLIGRFAVIVGGITWLYGVADGYFTARKR